MAEELWKSTEDALYTSITKALRDVDSLQNSARKAEALASLAQAYRLVAGGPQSNTVTVSVAK